MEQPHEQELELAAHTPGWDLDSPTTWTAAPSPVNESY